MTKEILRKLNYPHYILEEAKLENNLKILDYVRKESGARILLALKGFAFWSSFKKVAKYLDGITASGYYEARLGLEEFRKYNKKAIISVFSPAFKHKDICKIKSFSNHIIFNSFNQWESHRKSLSSRIKKGRVEVGLRINPLYSEVTPDIYNPCVKGSRLGINPSEFIKGVKKYTLNGVEGLHFHTHCEQNSDALKRTLEYVVRHFGEYIKQMKWINFGGGHHITREDYDIKLLIDIIKDFKAEFGGIDVYLEPGEAVGWKCGVLVGEVVDIIHNHFDIAITDLSAATHMPDCLEMPYIPKITGAKIIDLNQKHFTNDDIYRHHYRLGSPSCLAGDIIGDYAFKEKLKVGDKIIIEDMIHYTIVKNNTFNGIPLPSLAILKKNGKLKKVKSFDYFTYKNRNG